MTEQLLTEAHFPQEINFNPQIIAQILRVEAERPSQKMISELAELGVDLTKENVWAIFLFDSLKKVEGHLMIYLDRKEVTYHTRVLRDVAQIRGRKVGEIGDKPVIAVGEAGDVVSADLGLGTLRLKDITGTFATPAFGHVWFKSPSGELHIYHDCQFDMLTKSKSEIG